MIPMYHPTYQVERSLNVISNGWPVRLKLSPHLRHQRWLWPILQLSLRESTLVQSRLETLRCIKWCMLNKLDFGSILLQLICSCTYVACVSWIYWDWSCPQTCAWDCPAIWGQCALRSPRLAQAMETPDCFSLVCKEFGMMDVWQLDIKYLTGQHISYTY